MEKVLHYDGSLPPTSLHTHQKKHDKELPNMSTRRTLKDSAANNDIYGPYKTVDDLMKALHA